MGNIANQYRIVIRKPEHYGDAFFVANRANTNEAFKNLTKSGFGLYIWFLQNKSNYSFDLYSVKVQKDIGISARTYDNAVRELKEKKYLVYQGKDAQGRLTYYFYDAPQE